MLRIARGQSDLPFSRGGSRTGREFVSDNKSPAGARTRARGRIVDREGFLVVVMDDGLAAVAVAVFLLDHRGAVAVRHVLPDHGLVLDPIAVLAGRDTCADRTDVNADFVSERRPGQNAGRRRNQKQFPHLVLLSSNEDVNVNGRVPFRPVPRKNFAFWSYAKGSISVFPRHT